MIWSTPQFGFVRLSDAFSTGSSIMPQKKNPDAAELVRAKTGRINGHLIGLLTVMKGLPLTYSKDMQEDKEAVFDTAETLDLMLSAMTGMVADMTIDTAAMKKAAGAGFSTATDLADWLVRVVGLPFREAHHVTGRAVALAESRKVGARKAGARRPAGHPPRHHRRRVLGALGAEFGEEPHLLRRHRPRRSAQADPLLEETPRQGMRRGGQPGRAVGRTSRRHPRPCAEDLRVLASEAPASARAFLELALVVDPRHKAEDDAGQAQANCLVSSGREIL